MFFCPIRSSHFRCLGQTPLNWPDYVFDKKYRLPSLKEIEAFINNNKHLPGIPSTKEVEEKGNYTGMYD